MLGTYDSFHVSHVIRGQHGLHHEFVFTFFVGVVIKRLQHHCGHKQKEKLVRSSEKGSHVIPETFTRTEEPSVFMRWSITSISFLRPPGCVKWAVWEQTHGKMLRNSINIHKIFLDKLISNYLENAVLFFVCQSMVLFNVPTFFFYFPFRLLFSDDMKHDSTVSVFSVGFFSFFPCSAHFGPVWILEIHAEMPLRQMHRHTIKTSL